MSKPYDKWRQIIDAIGFLIGEKLTYRDSYGDEDFGFDIVLNETSIMTIGSDKVEKWSVIEIACYKADSYNRRYQ